MELKFVIVEDTESKYFEQLYDLYMSAFPLSERRTRSGFEAEINTEEKFTAVAVLLEDVFVGFFNYWKFDDFFYLENFAVLPEFRSRNVGSATMAHFMARFDKPLVFEVEPPMDVQATRRIAFYERLGFKILPYDYLQPPYNGNSEWIPMLLMSNDLAFAVREYEKIRNVLYNAVYRCRKRDY